MSWGPIKKTSESVWVVPCLADNFAYLVVDETSKFAAAVDPVTPVLFQSLISGNGYDLKFILITHHHWDHNGGTREMKQLYPCAEVIAARVDESKINKLGAYTIQSIATPCHTIDHICYLFESNISTTKPLVFTGDFLFRGGCGHFFEGSPQDFHSSVVKLFDRCPPDTLMYYGHDYCEGNFKFASHFDPSNDVIKEAMENTSITPPVNRTPSTLAEERKINLFVVSVLTPELIPAYHRHRAGSKLLCAYVREEKNVFNQ